MAKVFVSCPLGFEYELIQELGEFWPQFLGKDSRPHSDPLPTVSIEKGGIEFEASLEVAVQLQFFLKAANRVLLRLHSFRVRDFPKLFHEATKFPWQSHLHGIPSEIRVEAQGSRLNNEKRIEETLREAFQKVFPDKKSSPGTLYVRNNDDQMTWSWDLSGEHLHKRGWGRWKGPAPLRETIAAFGLRRLVNGLSSNQVGQLTFWDPFCGSGTMVQEAQMLWAGPLRRVFGLATYKKTPKLFLTEKWHLNYKSAASKKFKNYIGSDIDAEAVKGAESNQKLLEAQQGIAGDVQYSAKDFTGNAAPAAPESALAVLMNPPYGERLEGSPLEFKQNLQVFLKNHTGIVRWGLLAPSAMQPSPKEVHNHWQMLESVELSNGGLPIVLTVWQSASCK